MSTELAVRQSSTVSLIQDTARDLSAAMQIGNALASTIFVPPHFRGKPEECAAAILYGSTIDMDPVTSLQQIHVISGKPGLYARAMVAVVLANGHEVWTVEAGPEKVVIEGRRKGSDKVERSEWTTDRARKAGYFSNKKYETDPESMLYARASGDVSRRVAPDALLGMAYSVEELELEEHDAPEQVSARSSVSRLRAAVAPTPAIEAPATDVSEPKPVAQGGIIESSPAVGEPDEPEVVVPLSTPVDADVVEDPPREPEPTQPEPAIDSARMIARGQVVAIQASLNGFGVTNREQKLRIVSEIVSRPLKSSNDLTADEGKWVLDTLDELNTRENPRAAFDAIFNPPVE